MRFFEPGCDPVDIGRGLLLSVEIDVGQAVEDALDRHADLVRVVHTDHAS